MFCTVYSCIASYLNMHTATVAETIVLQLFSVRTHAEETLAIAVDLAIPPVKGVESPTEKNLDKDIMKQSHVATYYTCR